MKKFIAYLSPIAEYKLDQLVDKVLRKWGIQAKQNLLHEFDSAILKIETFPESSPKSAHFGGI